MIAEAMVTVPLAWLFWLAVGWVSSIILLTLVGTITANRYHEQIREYARQRGYLMGLRDARAEGSLFALEYKGPSFPECHEPPRTERNR